jgi:hypothetical protein
MQDVTSCLEEAARCRRLAALIHDVELRNTLLLLAADADGKADALRGKEPRPEPPLA